MADVKAKPILFSGPMVRALIEGRKTMTRRIVKCEGEPFPSASGAFLEMGPGQSIQELRCPYGEPGDLLWCRETFRKVIGQNGEWIETDYRSTYQPGDRLIDPTRWMPSIHMPRSASRLTLRITDVRVERAQEISEEDARSEGADPLLVPPDGGSCPHVEGFRVLWNSIHGPDAWSRNDWVWVIGFDVIRENVEQVVRA